MLHQYRMWNLPFLIWSFFDSVESAELCYQDGKFRAAVDSPRDECLYLDPAVCSMRYIEFVHTTLLDTEFLGRI